MFRFDGLDEGAQSSDGMVSGAYIHGLFANDAFRHAFLSRLQDRTASNLAYEKQIEDTLDDLAAHFEACLDLDQILSQAR